ncbi:hypothetical protein PTH_0999 [Pelotomaculum thermopropionicum SI]|uniref:Uncharacterized protein n=1 Tax=Pelotomaculum thermopropionicum (strain DSM 13744 / JCM 10971 / SI) TaxID=370438 RepID=A5D3K7_PELTS|nr:hypothetical protein PTH_0999 [Pelotomaculum thermopropionicum SI]
MLVNILTAGRKAGILTPVVETLDFKRLPGLLLINVLPRLRAFGGFKNGIGW